jgi:nucleoid-associated protein Lsr2
MAQFREVRLVDDLDGRPADETVMFQYDGADYEIDLSGEHARQLREALAPFVAAARPAGHRRPMVSERTRQQRADLEHNQSVRAWARQHNVRINRRGRIPEQVKRAYDDEAVRQRY